MASINYFKFAEDGAKITVSETFQTVASVAALTDFEEIVTGTPDQWVKKYSRPVSELATWLVEESRDIPGFDVHTKEMDKDGVQVLVTRTIMADSAITASDNVTGGIWTQISSEPISALVSRKVARSRAVPGNPIVAKKPDVDGAIETTTRILKDETTITAVEQIVTGTPNLWERVSAEPVTDKVAWEVTVARPIAP
jgi:hypothetical protein